MLKKLLSFLELEGAEALGCMCNESTHCPTESYKNKVLVGSGGCDNCPFYGEDNFIKLVNELKEATK